MLSSTWAGSFESATISKLLSRKLQFEIEMCKGRVSDGPFGYKPSIRSEYLNEAKTTFISLMEKWGLIRKALPSRTVTHRLEKTLFSINTLPLACAFLAWIVTVLLTLGLTTNVQPEISTSVLPPVFDIIKVLGADDRPSFHQESVMATFPLDKTIMIL